MTTTQRTSITVGRSPGRISWAISPPLAAGADPAARGAGPGAGRAGASGPDPAAVRQFGDGRLRGARRRWAGATRDAPARLRVIGNVAAGYVAGAAVAPGAAMRIMTGAPLPPGADAVVRFEETSEGDALHTGEPTPPPPRRAKPPGAPPARGAAIGARSTQPVAARRQRAPGGRRCAAPGRRCWRRAPCCALRDRAAGRDRPAARCRPTAAPASPSSPPATNWSTRPRRSAPARSTTPTATAWPRRWPPGAACRILLGIARDTLAELDGAD